MPKFTRFNFILWGGLAFLPTTLWATAQPWVYVDKHPLQLYFKQNAEDPAIIQTKSGLQYKYIKSQKGQSAAHAKTVRIRYEGSLVDGTIFDSSIARDEVVEFQLTNLIAGLQEGIKLMNVGETIRFYIPPQLAYGKIGAGSVIQPNSIVIFDIELVEMID